jgi:hypothetical protein
MELYSSELAQFELEDIAAGVKSLSLTRRQEGETALPDLATIVEAVKGKKVRRLRDESDRREREEYDTIKRDRELHPERYTTIADITAEVFAKKGLQLAAKKKQESKRGTCEHCGQAPLSGLSPGDLRALADVLEKRKANSERNAEEN